MKKILLLALFVSFGAFSQNVNDYQYVIVPAKFSIFKEKDRFKMNTMTKLLLEKYGFKVLMSTDTIPNEIGDNCRRLYADLNEGKDFLVTKIKLVLKDCKDNVVYETDYGKSREKDYNIAYNQALREAGKSFDRLNYKYNGKVKAATASVALKNEPVQAKAVEAMAIKPSADAAEVFFFAQPTATGFQVIDNDPKVIMRLFNTTQKNTFIAEKGNLKGIVITKNGQWFFEYYEGGTLLSEEVKLKF